MPDFAASIELCTYCPRLCSHTCPVSTASGLESLTPQAKVSLIGSLRSGKAELEAGPLYGCTGCGACTDACLYHVEPAQVLVRGRAEAVRRDQGHPALDDIELRFQVRGRAAASVIKDDPALGQRLAEPGQAALMPSCVARGGSGPRRDAAAVFRILDAVKQTLAQRSSAAPTGAGQPAAGPPEVGVLPVDVLCAGYPLYAAGQLELFRLHAETLARAVEPYSTLITTCSACTFLLRTQYAEHGVPLGPRVQHITEFLQPYLPALEIAEPLDAAYYHDPCHLGRRLGGELCEAPRQLLSRAAREVRELSSSREQTRCCGSGGLLPRTEPAIAEAMAKERLADRPAGTADAATPLVTACPSCAHHLSRSGDGAHDLIELVARLLGPA